MELIVSKHEQLNEAVIMADLRRLQAAKEAAWLLVPEQFTLQSDAHLLEALQVEALMDIHVKSFASLARDVLSREGDAKGYLTDSGRFFILRHLLESHRQKLNLFREGGRQNGISKALLETLTELRASGVTAEDLMKIADSAQGGLFKDKATETAFILKAYDQALGDALLDVEKRLIVLSEKLPKASWLKGKHIYVSAFQSMSAIELNVLAALEQLGALLHVSLVLPPEGISGAEPDPSILSHDAFLASWAFYQKLKEIGGKALRIRVATDQSPVLDDLSALACAAFSWESTVQDRDMPHFSMMQAPDVRTEVHTVLAVIRQRVISGRARFQDFNIAVTNPDVYDPLIRQACEALDMPAFIDRKRPLRDNPVAQFILLTLTMLRENLPMASVAAFVKHPLSGIPLEEGMRLENHSRARKLRGGMFFDARYFQVEEARYSHKESYEQACRAAAGAHRAAEQMEAMIGNFYRDSRKKETVRTFAECLYHFLSGPMFGDALMAYQRSVETWPDDVLAAENSQVLEKIGDLLDQMVAAIGDEKMDFESFCVLLNEGLETLSVGRIPPSRDQILVGSLSRTRVRPTKYQLILGLSDAWFPQNNEEKTVFSREEKEHLALCQVTLPSLEERLRGEETLALYQAFTRPQKHLFLSWSVSDSDRQSMRQARIVSDIQRIFPKVQVQSSFQYENIVRAYHRPMAMTWMLKQVHSLRRGDALKSEAIHEAAALKAYFMSQGTLWRHLQDGLTYTNRRVPLSVETAGKLYPALARRRVSISQLETFRRCPFNHFVRYGLRPQEEETMDLDMREVGSLVHKALDRLTRAIQEESFFLHADESEVCRRLDAYLDEESPRIMGAERLSHPQNKAVMHKIRKSTHRAGVHALRQLREGAFRPCFHEVHFAEGGALPAVKLQVGEEVVCLEGYIDRVDRYDAEVPYVRVVDYKAGRNEFDLSRALDGLDMQLLLYLRAACGLAPGTKPAGVFYLSLKEQLIGLESEDAARIEQEIISHLLLNGIVIDDPEIIQAMEPEAENKGAQRVLRFKGKKENVLPETLLEALTRHVLGTAEAVVKDLLAGEIDVLPANLKNERVFCAYCRFKGICRIENNNPDRPVPLVPWADLSGHLEKGGADENATHAGSKESHREQE